MVFMDRGFTSIGQESGSMFIAAVCEIQARISTTLSPYHYCWKIEEPASLKVKGSLYSCLLITCMSSRSRTLNWLLETIYIYSLLSEVPSYLILSLFHTDTSQSTESVAESSPPLNSISTVMTAVTSGVAAFACILLLAAICFCVIMLRKRTLKESKVLQHRTTVSKREEQGPHYEEIILQRPHYEEIQVQNYHFYHTLEPNA